MTNTKYRPNTKERNFKVDTVKGIFWYDDIKHLKKRIHAETVWLEKLVCRENINRDAVIKQAKLISQITDELSRITK